MNIRGAFRELHVTNVRVLFRHVLLDEGQGLLGIRGIGDGEEGLPVLVIAQDIEKGLERLAVDVIGGVDHDEGYGVDFGLVVEWPKHHHEDGRQDEGECQRPDKHAGHAHQLEDRVFERVPHGASPALVAKLAAGDFQEHVVERRRFGPDAPGTHVGLRELVKHVCDVMFAVLAGDGELAGIVLGS